jgi:hypothetical protein
MGCVVVVCGVCPHLGDMVESWFVSRFWLFEVFYELEYAAVV